MKTGEIIGVGAAVLVVGGFLFWVLHRQGAAVAQQSASQAAAAAAAAKASAASTNDAALGDLIARIGGRVLDSAATYESGGATAVIAASDKSDAVLV